MRFIIQRVNRAKCTANGEVSGEIQKGIMVLVGVGKKDEETNPDLKKLAKKLLKIRLWPEIIPETEEEGMEELDEEGNPLPVRKPKPWQTNLVQNNYGILVVSQFTLYGFFKGNKPDFHAAMGAEPALEIFNEFVEILRSEYETDKVQIGAFGEYMKIDMEGDGPVTMTIDTERKK